MFKDFINFVREQGVVGLAVGLAIGLAATETVQSIVEGFINPIVGFIAGGGNLATKSWTVVEASGSSPGLVIAWGSILSSVITLLAVAFVIYYVVKGLKLEKLDKKKSK